MININTTTTENISNKTKFVDTFFSYFDEQKQYNGMKFEVVREMTAEEYDKEEVGDMYVIRLENGKEIQAFVEEIDGEYEQWFKEHNMKP